MNIKVAGDDEFMRHSSSKRKERIKVVEKNREWNKMATSARLALLAVQRSFVMSFK